MKTLILTSLLVVCSSKVLFAQTDLTIFSNEGEFTLYVNGARQNSTPDTNVEALEIPGDQCQIRMKFEDASIPDFKSLVYFENTSSAIYEVKKNKNGKMVLRLISDAEYATTPKPSKADEAKNETAMENVKSVSLVAQEDADANGDRLTEEEKNDMNSVNKAIDGFVETFKDQKPVIVVEKDKGPTTKSSKGEAQPNEKTLPLQSSGNAYGRYRNAKGFCPAPNFTAQDVIQAKMKLDGIPQDYEFNKVEFIKTQAHKKCMTSKQIADLINKYLKSDNSKYDVAKYTFLKVYDPGNFDLVRGSIVDGNTAARLDAITLEYLASTDDEADQPIADQDGKNLPTNKPAKTNPDSPENDGEKKNQSGNIVINISNTSTNQNTSTSSSSTTSSIERNSSADNSSPILNPTSSANSICAIPQTRFNEQLRTIESKGSASTRMNIAKQQTKDKCLTTQQVISILKLFSMESDKLEFAKYAYTKISDKDSAYKIIDQFKFDSSITAFNEYMDSNN